MRDGILTESLSLAEEYVAENLRRETFQQHLQHGDEIEVDDMGQCDCLPVFVDFDVSGQPEGRWRLIGAKMKQRFRHDTAKLSATYKFEAIHV